MSTPPHFLAINKEVAAQMARIRADAPDLAKTLDRELSNAEQRHQEARDQVLALKGRLVIAEEEFLKAGRTLAAIRLIAGKGEQP